MLSYTLGVGIGKRSELMYHGKKITLGAAKGNFFTWGDEFMD